MRGHLSSDKVICNKTFKIKCHSQMIKVKRFFQLFVLIPHSQDDSFKAKSKI